VALGLGGGGGTVGTGYVKIKPDAAGFGEDLEREVGAEANSRAGGMGAKASMAFRGAFLAGAATIGKSLFDFAGFDAGMREVFTLMPDITAPAMDEMTAQVKAFAGEFGVLPDEVIPSLYNSISAGVPPDNVFEFLETAQMLAKGGATDLATAVDGLSSVVNAYGADTITATQASDALFTAVKLGKTTVDEMSASLFQVAPIASSFGVSFEEVSATIATLTAQGTPTAVAATQIKGAISELGKEGTKASQTFAELSGQTFAQFTASGGTMTEALTMMQLAAEENGTSIVDMFGSIEAGQAALGIVKDLDKTNANLTALGESAGATEVAFETMNEGLAATMARLKARFSVLLIDLGESLAPTFETIGAAVAGLLEVFMAMPAPLRTMIVVGGTLLAGLAAFAGPILKAIQLFKMLGSTMTLLAANPWVLAALALVAVTVLIIKNWDKVKAALEAVWGWIQDAAGALADWFVGLWEDVTGAVTAAWNGITGAISSAVSAIGDVISAGFELVRGAFELYLGIYRTLFETAWNVLRTIVETAWNVIRTVVETAMTAVRTAIEVGWAAISTVVTTAVGTVRTIVEGAWNALVSVTSTAWNGIKSTIETIGGGVVSFVTGIPNAITSAFSGLASLISTPFTVAFGAIKTAWNSTVGGFGFTAPSWIPGLGGKGFTIPSMATGGVASDPMLAMIGDAGPRDPEVVSPVSLLRETIADALADAGGSSAGGGLVIQGPLIGHAELRDQRDAVELSRELYREIERRQRAAGTRTSTVGALA
jgi:TP901 family phage tail tape measure protein